MILLKSRHVLVLACLILLVMPALTSAAVGSAPTVPLIGVGVPDILQEKSKLAYSWQDFKNDGEKALKNENYDEAIKNFDKAEGMLVAADPKRSAGTDNELSNLEARKGFTYANWDGHDAEEAAANQKATQLKASAKEKAQSSGSGCLIVTATFGSPMASEVQLVRDFRDGSIAKSYTGSRFMPGFNAWYYSFSPQVSLYINEHPHIKPLMQVFITPTLQIVLFAQACYSFLSFNRELATFTAILVGSTLYGLIYIFPTAMVGAWIARRSGWKGRNIRGMWPAVVAWITLLLLMIIGTVFSLDILTTITSGLIVVATIFLVVGSLTLGLSQYVGRKADAVVQE
jgi:hypothetical protein